MFKLENKYKQTISGLISLFMVSTNAFAITSPLVDPSRTGGQIVDIGYNGIKAPVAASIPKEFIDIPALSREIDKGIKIKERDIETFSCLTDDWDHENCEEQLEMCNSVGQSDPGYAIAHPVHMEAERIRVSSTANDPDVQPGMYADWFVPANYSDSHGQSYALIYDGTVSGLDATTINQLYNNGFQHNGKFAMKIFNKGAGWGGIGTTPPPNQLIMVANGGSTLTPNTTWAINSPQPNYATALAIWDSVPTGISFLCDDFCLAGSPMSPVGYWKWGCADPLMTYNPSTLKCELDYTWYEYKCSEDPNEFGEPWQGPVLQSGGDCNGVGLNSSLACNSSTPPAGNCVNSFPTCPSNPDKNCTKIAGADSLVENFFEGYKYSNGDALTHEETLTDDFNCPGENSTYDATRKICVTDLEYSCLASGYVYNADLGECIGDYACPGYWNSVDGKCEVEPMIECPVGYSYDSTTMRCEGTPYCNLGDFSASEFKCEIIAECDESNGWTYDETSSECTKPLDSVDPICNESFLTWQEGQGICDGYANFNDWEEVDPWGTGQWSVQNSGTQLYQSVNGPLPTFYLSRSLYKSSLLKGKIKINSASGDNDSVGIVMAYEGSANYFLINWEKEASGNSGGAYRLSIQQVNGGSPRNHGGTGGVTLGGANIGWTYNTFREIEVRTTDSSISVYIDGSFAAQANGVSIPDRAARIGFYNQSQNMVTYKDFYIATQPTCIAGYTYNVDYDMCYKVELQYTMDYGQGVYRTTPECPASGIYYPEERICKFDPTCVNGGSIDFTRKQCYLEEEISCKGSLLPSPGISFENCDINTICPTGYTLNEDRILCELDLPCPYADMINEVCYESMNANCSSSTAVVELSGNFPGYDKACADPAICSLGGNPQNLNGTWACVEPTPASIEMVCSGKHTGWNEIICDPGFDLKWESNADSARKGPVCQPTGTIVFNPQQDYELNSAMASAVPEYYSWISNTTDQTCDKAVNVLRCPTNPTSSSDMFTEVVSDGEYTGAKGTVGTNTGVACEAPIDYARNVWTESYSTVPAASKTCYSTGNPSYSDYDKTVTDYSNCLSSSQVCTATDPVTGACTASTTVCNSYGTMQVYDYTSYSSGTFTCVNNAGTSYGSGDGSVGNVSGAQTTSCTGTYGPSGSYNDESHSMYRSFDSSIDTCSLSDKGGFIWTETCPAGYEFNTQPNGSITAISSGSRTYNNRISSSSSNFNNERCYKLNAIADIVDFSQDKYLVNDFDIVQEYWSDFGIISCTTPNFDWDSSLERCVAPRDHCSGFFESSDGKCETQLSTVTCSTGYTYNTTRMRCEKDFVCPNGGIVNNSTGKCELQIQDPCLNQHIDGFDKVCATSDVCPAGTKKIQFEGEYYCQSDKMLNCPANYTVDPLNADKCIAVPYCKEGYVENEDSTGCKLDYYWTEYSCPAGWEGPVESGFDCNGICYSDGCSCNGSNAPENNCRQAFSTNSDTFNLYEKRSMEIHYINDNGSLSPGDFGEFRDMECGEKCTYYVNKIEGKGNNLCMEKTNGEKNCFEVNGCYFDGTYLIDSNNPYAYIEHLELMDQYTLGSREHSFRAYEFSLSGQVRFVSQPNHGLDYSEGGGNDFSSWNNSWKGEGISLSRVALKLSDGNWYIKQNAPAWRGCGDDATLPSNFRFLPDSAFQVNQWASTCYLGANSYQDCALDLTVTLPTGLSFQGYSDLESVVSNDFGVAACNGDNRYDENITIYHTLLDASGANFTRYGAGVMGSGSINVVELTCPYEYDRISDTCVRDIGNKIISTCKMNGHVGWSGRESGITSVGAGVSKTRYAIVSASGTASFDTDTYWEGFNIATMAIQLSDGFWYASSTFIDENGNHIERNLPNYIRPLGTSFYQFPTGSQDGLDCKYNGVNTPDFCGTELKIILPETKMSLVGISDIESLKNGDLTTNNSFNLDITIKDYDLKYKGTGDIEEKDLTARNVTSETELTSAEQIRDRLNFWDSFIDREIGSIEFIREVKNEDRAENFIAENPLPYNIAAKGFTVIEYFSEWEKTVFVKPSYTTPEDCQAYALEIDGSVSIGSTWPLERQSIANRLGVNEEGNCTVIKNSLDSFDYQIWGVRKNTYTGSYTFQCSPLTCIGHECAIATCPTEIVGASDLQNGVTGVSKEVQYYGTILPAVIDFADEDCRDQECDAKEPFVEYCGRYQGCGEVYNANAFEDTDGTCKEYYCEEGTYNSKTKSCQVTKCPHGTTEDATGFCVPN